MLTFLAGIGKWLASIFVGGSLEKILDVIDKKIDDGTKREEIKAKVTEKLIDAKANLMVGRTWWFQLFFVIPTAVHYSALSWVSSFPQWGWTVYPLPGVFGEWEGYIVMSLFLTDQAKAIIGRFK